MNTKRFLLSCVGVFVFYFLSDWLIHGHLLMGLYAQTANLWRSDAQMQQYFTWMMASQLLFAGAFCFVFLKNYEKKGMMEGLRYGTLIALLFAAHTLGMYAYMPIPFMLIAAWIIAMAVQLWGSGIIVASIYKPARR